MDPFGYDADQYAAAAAWVSVLVLAATGFVVWRQLRVAADLRRDQSRPFVVPSIGLDQFIFVLQVENVGNTPAHKVRFEFRPSLQSSDGEVESLLMFTDGIPTMPPGQRFRAHWESGLTVFSAEKPYELPMVYDVRVSYEDSAGHPYTNEHYFLDFRVYEGQSIGEKGVPELVKAVEDLHRTHMRWTDGVRGLAVNHTDADRRNRRDVRSTLLTRSRHALQQDGWRRAAEVWIDHWVWRLGLRRR